jgi:hypothetical protein
VNSAIPEPEWFDWATGQPPTVLDVWDGAPTLFLAPTTQGAILWWEFKVGDDESRYILLAHLTSAESQAVFDAPPDAGALEPVRRHIYDDRALVARRHPGGCVAERITQIPRDVTEEQFTETLLAVCADLAREKLPHPHHRRGQGGPMVRGESTQRYEESSKLDALAAIVAV